MIDLQILFMFLLLLGCLLLASRMRRILIQSLRDALIVSFLGFCLCMFTTILSTKLSFEEVNNSKNYIFPSKSSVNLLFHRSLDNGFPVVAFTREPIKRCLASKFPLLLSLQIGWIVVCPYTI